MHCRLFPRLPNPRTNAFPSASSTLLNAPRLAPQQMASDAEATGFKVPASILIIGSGVFGLSTAEALSRRPEFAQTAITVVDRGSGDDGTGRGDNNNDNDDDDEEAAVRHFPARDAASIDSSRIIRSDYADPAYAALAAEALVRWRGPGPAGDVNADDYIGGSGRYTESGLVTVADRDPDNDGPRDLADDDAPTRRSVPKKTGMQYVRESWANAQKLAADDPYLASRLKELPNAEAIRAAVGTGGTTGDWGYLNGASGWADAEASMAWVLRRVQKTGRVRFVRGRVVGIEMDGADRVVARAAGGAAAGIMDNLQAVGVRLADGRRLTADLTIAAAGAWTESLLHGVDATSIAASVGNVSAAADPAVAAATYGEADVLIGSLSATGQVVGYVPLASDEEHARVASMPVLLNLSSGLFVIPPAPTSRELKVARHAYGYVNPVPAAGGLPVSMPHTHLDTPGLVIPAEGAADLRRGLAQMVPIPDLVARPFAHTRLCWYTDTPTGDFIFDYYPGMAGLFLATGGSGHGFKFLPVLGDKIVDCLMGNPPYAFRDKWCWQHPVRHIHEQPGASPAARTWWSVVTEDGSRGGKPGLVLQDEFAKTT